MKDCSNFDVEIFDFNHIHIRRFFSAEGRQIDTSAGFVFSDIPGLMEEILWQIRTGFHRFLHVAGVQDFFHPLQVLYFSGQNTVGVFTVLGFWALGM